ncbi:MAG: beta-galactosidase GalB [Bacteroidales bacterium]
MTVKRILLTLVFSVVITTIKIFPQNHIGKRSSFNDGWLFSSYMFAASENSNTGKEPENLQSAGLDDSKWQKVDLPHDWAIACQFNDSLENGTGLLPWKGIGWYRKHFFVEESEAGKRIFVDFDGAMAYAKIWLNGTYIGEWPYGYTSFRMDLTPAIKAGKENIIAVRLDTKSWDSRWYPGAGLYRNVWISSTADVHFTYNGIYVTTPEIKKEKGTVSVEAEIMNQSSIPAETKLKAVIYKLEKDGKTTGEKVAESVETGALLPPAVTHRFRFDMSVSNPVLWELDNPALYRVVVTAYTGGKTADIGTANFGFRTLLFTAREGFYLNGKKTEIKGVCNHHDLGALGAAFNTRAAERQLEILKEMGCNAIRTSHNPPAPELLDLCDRMGFMVEDEAFDAWRKGKKKNDYNKLFDAWHEEDLRAMVRRDRNHPSVIIWSIGNEVPDQGNYALADNLRRIVKSEDNTRPVTSGCDHPSSVSDGFQKALDLFGINYRLKEYQKFFTLSDNTLLPFHSSESASTVSSRGEYFFPVVQGDLNNNLPGKGICQVSSYDLAYPDWASTPDQQWEMNDKYPGVIGEFVWTGFDYLGEPTPYNTDATDLSKTRNEKRRADIQKWIDVLGTSEIPSRSSYFGIMDLAGFKKDRFWLYQSRWRSDLPMVHILPHWNWPERKGLVTPVHVYTSGDEAELFLNGKSMGRKTKGQYEYRLRWDDIVYQPGELKVIAYRNGNKWAEETVSTTGKASKIAMEADRAEIFNDGYDLAFVTVKIQDRNGILVPRSNNEIKFSIEGPGRIVATDNGDPTDHELFSSANRKAFNGMCLVIVRLDKGAAGPVIIKAEAKGLKGSNVQIKLKK